MALKRNETYPGRFNNPSPEHPQGGFKNRTSASSKDGSYLESQWLDDWDGFFGRLFTVAGTTLSGTVDTALDSQAYDALVDVIKLNNAQLAPDKKQWPTIANNVVDPVNDMDFSAGAILDSTGTVIINATALTKALDAPFVEGAGGGLFSGVKAINTTYHCFTIYKADGSSDAGYSTDPNASDLPAGFVGYRRIHDIETDPAGAIKSYLFKGDYVWLNDWDLVLNTTSPGTTGAVVQVVPIGPKKTSIVNSNLGDSTTTNKFVRMSNPDAPNEATTEGYSLVTGTNENNQTAQFEVPTNNLGEVRYRANVATVAQGFTITVLGWIDDRSE